MAQDQTGEDLVLTPHSDRELWVLNGPESAWALPMWLNHYRHDPTGREYALLSPSFVPYETQAIAMQAVMEHHDISGGKTTWVISMKAVEALMTKAPGITPSYYYRWDSEMPMRPAAIGKFVQVDATKKSRGYENDAFIKHVAQQHGLQTSIIRVVLSAVSAEAPSYMVENRYVLNLGFCRLMAVPFRSNWKQIVMFKLRKSAILTKLLLPDEERWKALEDVGLPQMLCSPQNIGVVSKNKQAARVCYTLEAVPNQRFEDAANRIEYKRACCGSSSYVAEFEKTVESLYIQIVQALASYVRKARLPFARVHEGSESGVVRFVPTSRLDDKRVHGIRIRDIPIHIVETDKAFSVTGEQSQRSLVRAEVKALPPVPIVPQGTEDVREPEEQRDVVGDGPGRTDGVPVLDADQIENAGQPMLPTAETAGQHDRLDGQRDP